MLWSVLSRQQTGQGDMIFTVSQNVIETIVLVEWCVICDSLSFTMQSLRRGKSAVTDGTCTKGWSWRTRTIQVGRWSESSSGRSQPSSWFSTRQSSQLRSVTDVLL